MKNILVLYVKTPGSTGQYFIKVFENMGYNVEIFDTQLNAPRWITAGKISLPLGKNTSVTDVIKKSRYKPDLILHIDGALRHLSDFKKIDIPKIFYAVDSHLTLNFHKNILSDFDLVFEAQKDYISALKEVKEKTFWLPLACDPLIHKKYDIPNLFDIGFVGRIDPMYNTRVRLLKILSEKYDVLSVNGLKHTDISKIYSQSRIGFNKSILGDLNMRVFEVMSSGTMLLTDRISNGMEELFNNKEHLVLYNENDEKEMLELATYYLEHEDERIKITKAGQREVHAKHTYENRVIEMMNIINKYL